MLAKRQKRIILVSTLSFFLAIMVVIFAVLFINKKQKVSSSSPQKNNLPNDKANLAKVKNKTITFLEEKLSTDNIKSEFLLRELKNEHILNVGENNLRDYLNGATTSA